MGGLLDRRGWAIGAAAKQRPPNPPTAFFGAGLLTAALTRFDRIRVAKGNLPHPRGTEVGIHDIKGRTHVVLGDVGGIIEQAQDFRLPTLVCQEAHAAAFVLHAQRPKLPTVVLHQAGVAVAFGIELARPESLAG